MDPTKCLGVAVSTNSIRTLEFLECASTLARRFRVLSDGQIEIDSPTGWGIYLLEVYISTTDLNSIPKNGHWTLVRTRSEGQRVSVMLMNQGLPDPSKPSALCVHNNYLNDCKYDTYKHWNVMPYCPTAFPTIGK
jgi:hypothetical protein